MSAPVPRPGGLAGPGPDLAPSARPGTVAPDPLRDEDLRIAAVLLRGGQPAPARAALEAAHARVPLTAAALLDLAEARWRMGALDLAGRAAETYLMSGDAAPIATVIAAEAAMADGRPADARAWVARSAAIPVETIEALFAGLGRSELWPADPLVPESGRDTVAPLQTDLRAMEPAGPPGRSPGLPPSARASPIAPTGRDSTTELSEAMAMLRSGAGEAAALRLAVLLRRAPETAPLVIEALEGASGPIAALARGDAHRLIGNLDAARTAYAAALASPPPAPPPGRHEPPEDASKIAPDGRISAPEPPPTSSSSQEENP